MYIYSFGCIDPNKRAICFYPKGLKKKKKFLRLLETICISATAQFCDSHVIIIQEAETVADRCETHNIVWLPDEWKHAKILVMLLCRPVLWILLTVYIIVKRYAWLLKALRCVALMTCNINKVVMCFLLSAFFLFHWAEVVEISRYRTSSGQNCHCGSEKLHEAITATASRVQRRVSDSTHHPAPRFVLIRV